MDGSGIQPVGPDQHLNNRLPGAGVESEGQDSLLIPASAVLLKQDKEMSFVMPLC